MERGPVLIAVVVERVNIAVLIAVLWSKHRCSHRCFCTAHTVDHKNINKNKKRIHSVKKERGLPVVRERLWPELCATEGAPQKKPKSFAILKGGYITVLVQCAKQVPFFVLPRLNTIGSPQEYRSKKVGHNQ